MRELITIEEAQMIASKYADEFIDNTGFRGSKSGMTKDDIEDGIEVIAEIIDVADAIRTGRKKNNAVTMDKDWLDLTKGIVKAYDKHNPDVRVKNLQQENALLKRNFTDDELRKFQVREKKRRK